MRRLVCLQRTTRGFLSRRKLEALQQLWLECAATHLQRCWRGASARQRLRSALELWRHVAIVHVQRCWRGALIRERIRRAHACWLRSAATSVQRHWRGSRARRHIVAIFIQSVWRGYAARRRRQRLIMRAYGGAPPHGERTARTFKLSPHAVQLVEMLNGLLQLNLNQKSMRDEEYGARVSGSMQQIRKHLMAPLEEKALALGSGGGHLVTRDDEPSAAPSAPGPMTRAVASLLPHLQRDQELVVEALRADAPKAVAHIGSALANTKELLGIVKDLKQGRGAC